MSTETYFGEHNTITEEVWERKNPSFFMKGRPTKRIIIWKMLHGEKGFCSWGVSTVNGNSPDEHPFLEEGTSCQYKWRRKARKLLAMLGMQKFLLPEDRMLTGVGGV